MQCKECCTDRQKYAVVIYSHFSLAMLGKCLLSSLTLIKHLYKLLQYWSHCRHLRAESVVFDNTDANVLVLRKLYLCHWKQNFFLVCVIFGFDYLSALPVWILSSLMCLVWCQPTRFARFTLFNKSFHCCSFKKILLWGWQPQEPRAFLLVCMTSRAWKAVRLPHHVANPINILYVESVQPDKSKGHSSRTWNWTFPWEISPGSRTCWVWRCSWRCRTESPGWHRWCPALRNVWNILQFLWKPM